jgi:hypothetical protein
MSKSENKPMGRPSLFTDELALEICDWISDGKSLRSFCEQEGRPAKISVLRWLRDNPDFSTQYARAREDGADSLADDIQDITDKVLSKEYDPNAARVAMDGKKWIAAKLKPKKYSERLDLTSGGEKINRATPMEDIDAILAAAEAESQRTDKPVIDTFKNGAGYIASTVAAPGTDPGVPEYTEPQYADGQAPAELPAIAEPPANPFTPTANSEAQ